MANPSASRHAIILQRMRDGDKLSLYDQLMLIFSLSLPAVLAQLSSIAMSYIDASMVGHLGQLEGAAIGIVSSSTWLIWGLSYSCAVGFTVQTAHLIGAKKNDEARSLMKLAFCVNSIFTVVFTSVILGISPFVPRWLGAGDLIYRDAFLYFFIFALSLPIIQFNSLATGMLQCSGNMRFPSIVQILMGVLNVAFNYLFIYVFNMGVKGAAIATLLARLITTFLLLFYLLFRSDVLALKYGGKMARDKVYLFKAFKIGLPVAFEQVIMSGGQVAFTRIVSPLGELALSANSFAITAESLCYMPAYGLSSAATTITGQCYGSGQKKLTWHLGWLTTSVGITLQIITGVLMFVFARQMIGFISPDPAIIELGAAVLMIEAFSEPLYGASLVASGALAGTGDTLVPSCIKFFSMWMIRIPLALFLRSRYGLEGVWFAMSFELCVRGILFLLRLGGKSWTN